MKIAVIGGGIAGYMAAAHIGRFVPAADLVHIHDPAVPPIGVGEGTLPAFRRWLDSMSGLSFAELQAQAAVTWKKGIRFEGWGQSNAEFNHFFGGGNVAYHISAEKICPLLARHIIGKPLSRSVATLESSGRAVAVNFQEGDSAVFDFVFDARGFPKTLTTEHQQLSAIPTNAAVIRRGPVSSYQGATRAVARPHGWIFVIPLATDTAYGYIYNAELTSSEELESDLDRFLQAEGIVSSGRPRSLRFPNFRCQRFFDGALFSIGNSASFLEPLEATAIGVILHQLQVATCFLRDELVGVSGEGRWHTAVLEQINNDLVATIDAVALFVGWHYARGSIHNTPFWQSARQNFSDHLQQARHTETGRCFERLRQAGQAFPPAQLSLIPDADAFANRIAPNRRVNQNFAGFDEFSFAQIGYGTGEFSAENSEPRQTSALTSAPSAATLRRACHQLEQALTDGIDPIPILAEYLTPELFDLAAFAQMGLSIKKGPSAEHAAASPGQIIDLVQRAAVAGHVPPSSPYRLRRLLDGVANDLRRQKGWASGQPLWWEPLPLPSAQELIWRKLESGEWLRLPDASTTHESLGDTTQAPLWLHVSRFIRADLVGQIHESLEAAFQSGQLPLERGAVGDVQQDGADIRDERAPRTDWVRFITGLEADLIQAAPELAGLVHYLLQNMARHLQSATGRSLQAPQQAMLSRYPAGTSGYAPHMDNPGGAKDNGRILTMVLYLNSPEQAPAGGELVLWDRNSPLTDPPAGVFPPHSGAAVLFDSRRVPHQVRPLGDGPARWALTLWFNDRVQPLPELPRPPITLSDVLRPIPDPPLPTDSILFHQWDESDPAGTISVHPTATLATRSPRAGLVCTVYQAGKAVDAWCAHHLELGFEHVVLIFDSLEEASETADANRLRSLYSPARLTIWAGSEMPARWEQLAPGNGIDDLRRMAGFGRSSQAVSVRQTLNASAVLQAARNAALGGVSLDWLLHLDVDELFYLQGSGRGGATLSDHFSAAEKAGWHLIRYLNHELLPSDEPSPLFKINPRLAISRLGTTGWARFEAFLRTGNGGSRPYFHGYRNGKSAVRVQAALAAAGVHSWYLAKPGPERQRLLAGPVVLHFRTPTSDSFGRKYQQIATAPTDPASGLFSPASVEEQVLTEMEQLKKDGASEAQIQQHLENLFRACTHYSPEEIDLLRTAGLIFQPRIPSHAR